LRPKPIVKGPGMIFHPAGNVNYIEGRESGGMIEYRGLGGPGPRHTPAMTVFG
jgi:hypothetical protein